MAKISVLEAAVLTGYQCPGTIFWQVPLVPTLDMVNGESKTHSFVGWLSGQKNCCNGVKLLGVVSERGPIIVQDNGQRYINFPILFYPIVHVKTILGPQSLSLGFVRFEPSRNL